eukprot:g7874.t1
MGQDGVVTRDEQKPKKRVHFAEVECEIIEEPDMEETEEMEYTASKETKETDWLKDVQSVEEELQDQDEETGGIAFEPFNLDEEREHGTFQDDGFYVENRKDKSEEFDDAWLASNDSKPCSAAVIENHERIQNALAAADEAQKLTNDELCAILDTIVNYLLPRETILSALKRAVKNKSQKSSKDGMKDFEALTEAADALLSNGDTDAYSKRKEEFAHELESLRRQSSFDPSDDMFASGSDTAEEETNNIQVKTNQSVMADQETTKRMKLDLPERSGNSSGANSQTNFESWPIAELKRFLGENKVDWTGILEKEELVQKAKEVNVNSTSYEAFQAPEGYVYDPSSGYFYSSEHEMYYDGPTRCFYNPKTTTWYDEHWNQIN